MIEFQVFVWMIDFGFSVLLRDTVKGKTAKQAFNKARKAFPNIHSSRIRVERKND